MITTRHSKDIMDVALTTDVATTQLIEAGDFASGQVHIPAGSGITGLTFWSAPNSKGTFLPCYDAAGNAVVQTVVHTRSYPIPSTVMGSGCLKIVVNTNGTVHISMKS